MIIMKKVLLLSIYILLTCTIGCGSKSKLVHEEIQQKKEHIDSVAHKSEIKITQKDSTKESDDWVWEPEDANCKDPVEITKPDGTKIKIPGKGRLRHNNESTHSKVLEIKKDVVGVKKTIDTKGLTRSYNKEVERKVFNMPWWLWILIVIVLIGIVYWECNRFKQ